jgi:hypothetical protein
VSEEFFYKILNKYSNYKVYKSLKFAYWESKLSLALGISISVLTAKVLIINRLFDNVR